MKFLEEILYGVALDSVFTGEYELVGNCYEFLEETYPNIDPELIYDCDIQVWDMREGPNKIGTDYSLEITDEIENEFKKQYPELCI